MCGEGREDGLGKNEGNAHCMLSLVQLQGADGIPKGRNRGEKEREMERGKVKRQKGGKKVGGRASQWIFTVTGDDLDSTDAGCVCVRGGMVVEI